MLESNFMGGGGNFGLVNCEIMLTEHSVFGMSLKAKEVCVGLWLPSI